MTPHANPTISLRVSTTAGDHNTAYSATALRLAAAYNHELLRCKDDMQKRQVCCAYRDKILSISRFAEDVAAAFKDAFTPFLQDPSQGSDAKWQEFTELARRERPAWDSTALKLRHQVAIVAIWGEAIFKHYGWRHLSLGSMKLLHSVARELREWESAVDLFNCVMLERHEQRVIQRNNRSMLIGEHPRSSKTSDPKSPVEAQDIRAVLDHVKGVFPIYPGTHSRAGARTIAGTPLRDYGLEPDKYGMIVPHSAPGVLRESSSPSGRPVKRCKLDRRALAGHKGPEQRSALRNPQADTTVSAHTSDAEMTEVDGISASDLTSEGLNHHARVITSVEGLRRRRRDPESPAPSTRTSVRSGASHEISGDDPSSAGRSVTCAEAPTAAEMPAVDDQGSSGDALTPQDPSASSLSGHGLLSPRGTDRSLEAEGASVDSAGEDAVGEVSPAVLISSMHTPQGQSQTARDELRTDNGCDDGTAPSEDIAALEATTRIHPSNQPSLPEERPCQALDGLQTSKPHVWKEKVLNPTSCSMATSQGRFIPASPQSSLHQYCTDTNVNEDGTLTSRMASRYSGRLRDLLHLAESSLSDRSIEEHNKLKIDWLSQTRWANSYSVPTELDCRRKLPLDADVWYMGWETFQKRAAIGEVFNRPILIKQSFQDSGMYDLQGYVSALKERFMFQEIDVQNSESGECCKMDIVEFCEVLSSPDDGVRQVSAVTSNAINLRKIANADAPLFTRMRRFRLLETLVDRASNIAPGKRTSREAHDVSECLGFDLLGLEGAFTRPHVDALSGTWVRCLSGSKAWVFASGMNDKDWDDFTQQGPKWIPAGKGRVIILEKDDVLLMPPGLRALHAVFTIEPSLMEGGMVWDENNIPALLGELLWLSQNQLCTNEAIAYQLPSIINALEAWVQENSGRLASSVNYDSYLKECEIGIKNLQGLGCRCVRRCSEEAGCPCIAQERRCLSWCLKHPTLPGHSKGRTYECMYDR